MNCSICHDNVAEDPQAGRLILGRADGKGLQVATFCDGCYRLAGPKLHRAIELIIAATVATVQQARIDGERNRGE
jgi:hypothetical protein